MSFRDDAMAPARFATTSAACARRFVVAERMKEQARSNISAVSQIVCLWLQRHKDRTTLRSLSQRDLHDFCPRHGDAEAEMSKPFWQA